MKLEKLKSFIPTIVNSLTMVVLFYVLPMGVFDFLNATFELNPINLDPLLRLFLLLYWAGCGFLLYNKLNAE